MKLADQKYCYECAAVIRRDAGACRVCGAAQPDLPPSRGPWPLERPEAWPRPVYDHRGFLTGFREAHRAGHDGRQAPPGLVRR